MAPESKSTADRLNAAEHGIDGLRKDHDALEIRAHEMKTDLAGAVARVHDLSGRTDLIDHRLTHHQQECLEGNRRIEKALDDTADDIARLEAKVEQHAKDSREGRREIHNRIWAATKWVVISLFTGIAAFSGWSWWLSDRLSTIDHRIRSVEDAVQPRTNGAPRVPMFYAPPDLDFDLTPLKFTRDGRRI